MHFVYELFVFNTFPADYNIMEKLNEGYLTTFRDEQTMTEVAYSEKGLVSYDDERAICDKTEYAMVHNLVSTGGYRRSRLMPLLLNIPPQNGYIIWELSGDIMPGTSDLAIARLTKLI